MGLARDEVAARPHEGQASGQGTVAIDFDGVIGEYDGNPAMLPARPLPGAVSAMKQLKSQGYWLLIFSSRAETSVRTFLDKHDVPYDDIVAGPDKKPIFRVLVDDRAITFDGNWTETVRSIHSFQPHWRRN